MSRRGRAIGAMLGLRIKEISLSPWLYVVASIGLLVGFVLVREFLMVVDSSGLAYTLSPVYEAVTNLLRGVFGEVFLDGLFAHGPFLLAVHAAVAPFLGYLVLDTSFRLRQEFEAGVVDLICFGPADTRSFVLAMYLRNLLLCAAYLCLVVLFFQWMAGLSNTMLDRTAILSVFAVFLLTASTLALVIVASVLIRSATGASFVAGAGLLLLFAAEVAGYALPDTAASSIGGYLWSFLRWVSPVHHWSRSIASAGFGNIPDYALDLLAQLGVAAAAIATSQLILFRREMRA